MSSLSVKAYDVVVQDFCPLARNITRFSNGFRLNISQIVQEKFYILFTGKLYPLLLLNITKKRQVYGFSAVLSDASMLSFTTFQGDLSSSSFIDRHI